MLPRVCLVLASWLVPRIDRHTWLRRRLALLSDLRILIMRGEFPSTGNAVLSNYAADSWSEAFRQRFEDEQWHRFFRGPLLFFTTALVMTLITAMASRGFSYTKTLIQFGLNGPGTVHRGDPFGIFLTFAIPIVFAFLVGMVLILLRGPGLQGYGWKYWSFFVAKVAIILTVVPVVWMEATPFAHAFRPHAEAPRLLFNLLWRLVFIAGFGIALGWSFADQRRRCPSCLRLLALPVCFGSRASVFEPAVTELVCEDGHGSLAIQETEDAAADRWTKLDASWQHLFRA